MAEIGKVGQKRLICLSAGAPLKKGQILIGPPQEKKII
jgi:hypothetical protein